jgi:hypothetical protein
MSKSNLAVSTESVEQAIYLIRGQKVMLDRDLAGFYGVQNYILKRAVRRNIDRFPGDFMFQLTLDEANGILSCQIGSLRWGQHAKYPPYAFTPEGVAMLASVLRSPQAARINIAIMRAFVRLRQTLSLHKDLAHKLADLERKIETHDESIRTLFEAIRQLMAPSPVPKKEIGFHVKDRLRESPPPYRIRRSRPRA